jgi:hypothetical protein
MAGKHISANECLMRFWLFKAQEKFLLSSESLAALIVMHFFMFFPRPANKTQSIQLDENVYSSLIIDKRDFNAFFFNSPELLRAFVPRHIRMQKRRQ